MNNKTTDKGYGFTFPYKNQNEVLEKDFNWAVEETLERY